MRKLRILMIILRITKFSYDNNYTMLQYHCPSDLYKDVYINIQNNTFAKIHKY